MKEKTFNYGAEAEITTIACTVYDAQINLFSTDDGKITVSFPNDTNVSVGNTESELYITQTKRPFYKFKRQAINVYVPGHVLPAVRVNGKKYSLNVKEGIYGELELNSDGGVINLDGCSFNGISLNGNACPSLSGVTVKNCLNLQMGRGNIVILNSFATRAECRVRRGNIGLSALACKNCVLEAGRGNVLAALNGDENEYDIKILIKEGSSNRESVQRENAKGSLQAYVEKGNVNVDFLVKTPKIDEATAQTDGEAAASPLPDAQIDEKEL